LVTNRIDDHYKIGVSCVVSVNFAKWKIVIRKKSLGSFLIGYSVSGSSNPSNRWFKFLNGLVSLLKDFLHKIGSLRDFRTNNKVNCINICTEI